MSNLMFFSWNSKFGFKNKFLDTLQLLEPAERQPDPGIEVTYPKSDPVCLI